MVDYQPLASVAQLAAWTGDTIAEDNAQALAYLNAASSLVRSETGQTWADAEGALDSPPADVVTVTTQVAARIWRNPDGYIQDTTGPFTVRVAEKMGEGLFLTAAEKSILSRYRSTRSPLWTLSTTRESEDLETTYLPVTDGEPIPGYPGNGL